MIGDHFLDGCHFKTQTQRLWAIACCSECGAPAQLKDALCRAVEVHEVEAPGPHTYGLGEGR